MFQFSHYFSLGLLRPFSVNHVFYLDTKPKHRPQKVITKVSTTAETINSFTVHLFLHFIEHSPLSYISVGWRIKSDLGIMQLLHRNAASAACIDGQAKLSSRFHCNVCD